MKIVVTEKIISIPPYISTSWDNVISIHKEKNELIFSLKNGEKISVPSLNEDEIRKIFSMHASSFDSVKKNTFDSLSNSIMDIIGKIDKDGLGGIGLNLGNLSFMEHDSSKSDSPNMSEESLKRISSMIKMFIKNSDDLPPAEPHCNCNYCQVYRFLNDIEGVEKNTDEEVSPDDLKFREWDVEQEGENLYKVTNPLDKNEVYKVFLGNPIGCTCGKDNCEHIEAVLRS